MAANYSGIRELQIARGLITLRWASIPIIFGFSIFSKNTLGMSFQIEPVYILCCLLALLNVFYTVHFSMLSRQMAFSKGIPGLKRFMGSFLSKFLNNIKSKGIKAFASLPAAGLKLISILYLMLLEALKDVPFNILSLDNVMHTQIIGDLVFIIMLARYTGTTESPLTFLMIIPVTVAGAVMGAKAGTLYALAGVGAWFVTGILVKYGLLTHIKFYSPLYGDLSQCQGWIVSNSFVMLAGLGATAYLANKLTSIFKERIFYLNSHLFKSRNNALSSSYTAQQIPEAWMVIDPDGNIDKVKLDYNQFFASNLSGKNLFKEYEELEQYGIAYVVQSVITGGNKRTLERITLSSKEGTRHLFDCKISSFKNSEGKTRLLVIFNERTEEIHLKNRVEQLKTELNKTKAELERTSLENKENLRAYQETLKIANERSVEIEVLNQKLSKLKNSDSNKSNQISSLMTELASVKAQNDELSLELQYKQLMLEDIVEMIDSCTELTALTTMVEKKARELFELDNSCLHIFHSTESKTRLNEILDTRKASPRLLDIPRNNPEALSPVLKEGRPVIINAQITPDKNASMAISNGPLQRLVAYIPVRHKSQVLGMMMLEQYGQNSKTETMIEGLSYYLKHCAAAIKNALQNQDICEKNSKLNLKLTSLHTQLDSIKAMIFNRPDEESQPFTKFLFEFGKIVGLKDALMVRIHNDGSSEASSRLDRSKGLELNNFENKVLQALKEHPDHKATTELLEEETTCCAYPLLQGSRLLGILYTYYNEAEQNHENLIFTDFCVRLVKDQLALYVMNEEKELWESFYRENLSA
ncbi:MAG: hypothetical protein ACQETH_09770 [Candidatus Rifleibacteriota bacterium]